MTTVGGIQGSYNGKSYAVLFSDLQRTNQDDGKKGISKKLHSYPDYNYAFGSAGPDLTNTVIAMKELTILHTFMKHIYGEIPSGHKIKPSFQIALLLYGRLIRHSVVQEPGNIENLSSLCQEFGEFAAKRSEYPAEYFSELSLKYLTMTRDEFNSTLIHNLISQNTEFFDMFNYAMYDPIKEMTHEPHFLFSINQEQVQLYAVTSRNQNYTMLPPVTNFAIGSGKRHVSTYFIRPFGAILDEIEMPLKSAIKHALKALQIANRKDAETAGLDIMIVKENEIISYRDLIQKKVDTDPQGLLDTILNTPL